MPLGGKLKSLCDSPRYIKALETMRQLRLKQNQTVKECQVELRYLKQNKEKAQQIRETVATKESQLMASKDSVQQIENQIDPLEVIYVCMYVDMHEILVGTDCCHIAPDFVLYVQTSCEITHEIGFAHLFL